MLEIDAKYPPGNPKTNFDSCTKNCKKSAVKHSIERPILLNFLNLGAIFAHDCQRKHIFVSNSAQTLPNLHFLEISAF